MLFSISKGSPTPSKPNPLNLPLSPPSRPPRSAKQVLLKVITEKPGDAVTSFENLSIGVKGEKVTLPPAPDSSAEASGPVLDWSTKTAALFVKPDEAPEGVPGPDLMADAGMYEWAGVR